MTRFWHCKECNDWCITDIKIPSNVYHLNPGTGEQCNGTFRMVPIQGGKR